MGIKVHSIAPLRLLAHRTEILEPSLPSCLFHSMLSICIGVPLPAQIPDVITGSRCPAA
jgi:hypothetical protein